MLREIIRNVWIGSFPNERMLEECDADAIICTVKKMPGVDVIDKVDRFSAYAIPDGKRFDTELFTLAVEDLDLWYAEGRTILVHCHAGRNRSCTAVALFLIRRGWTPQEAIDHIRTLRPRAIANPVFEAALLAGGLG